MPLHTWHCQGPWKPSSYATFMPNSYWGRAATGKKKSCIYVHRVTLVVSDSLPPCRPWPARLLSQGGGLSRKEYWNQLANIGCHTLLEHYISCFPNCKLPEYLVLPEPLKPKQLHHHHTWPSQGQTQILQGSLRSKPRWTTHRQRWK